MGSNAHGQLGIGEVNNQMVKFAPVLVDALVDQGPAEVQCGNYHSIVVTKYGSVYSWGNNDYG